MKNFLALPPALLFSALAVIAQPINKPKLDSLFDVLAAKNLAKGTLAVSKNGKLVYQRSIGEGANANTEYRIGSITKLFTATIVFQLLEEKRLSLDDRLSKYYPQLPNAGEITIGNLLNHRSGLPDFTRNTDFDSWKEHAKTPEQLLELIGSRPPDFAPNAKADYNNSNYLLLSLIVEKATGTPYSTLLDQRIFRKLGLIHTYYVQQPTLAQYEAASYHYADNKWTTDKLVALENFRGAGGIISTSADLLHFVHALFYGKLVSGASLHKMGTWVEGYGMGMFPFDVAGHKGFGHNGKTEGFASSLTYYPDEQLAIAYCTNGEVYSKNYILDGVRDILFHQPYTVPSFEPVKLSGEILDRDTGTYKSIEMGIEAIVRKNGEELLLETRGKIFHLVALNEQRFWNRDFGFFFDIDAKGLTIIDVESEYRLEKQ